MGAAAPAAGGALALGVVYLSFAGFLGYVLRVHPEAGSCGCAGPTPVPPSRLHLVLNVLAGLAAFGVCDDGGAASVAWIGTLGLGRRADRGRARARRVARGGRGHRGARRVPFLGAAGARSRGEPHGHDTRSPTTSSRPPASPRSPEPVAGHEAGVRMSAVLDLGCDPRSRHADAPRTRRRGRNRPRRRADPVRDAAGFGGRRRPEELRELSGRQPLLRLLHRVLLHASRRRQLRVPAEHVRRRLVAVQLRRHESLQHHEHALLPGLLDQPGRVLSRRVPLRQRRLHELQDLLRRVPIRAVQHGHPVRDADPMPLDHVRDPVSDRLPGLRLLLGRRPAHVPA